MRVYIIDNEYEFVGMIDEAESVLWQKKYNDVGECEIYVPCDGAYLDMLRRGYYVYRYDDDMFCKIESVEITTDIENGDYIIATAADACKILSGRIVRWQTVYSGTVAGFVERLLTDNVINPAQEQRRIANFTIDTSNFGELSATINVSVKTDDLLQLIISVCTAANYGFRVSYDIDTRQLVFRLYNGKNKATMAGNEYVEFSPQFSNIISSNFKTDESNYKNVAYVGYKSSDKEDETVYLLSVYNGGSEPSGEERREIYIDGTGTSRDITYDALRGLFPAVESSTVGTGENATTTYQITVDGQKIAVASGEGTGDDEKITVTDYTYLLLIRTLGFNALAASQMTEEFTGEVDTVDTYEYKADYDLGDIVKAVNDYGIEAAARIVAIMESDDTENGHVVEPIFEFIS